MLHTGQCHCGAVKASLETEKTLAALGVRTCQCDFCRRHGAINISDPDGLVTFDVKEKAINRYAFALRTADFLVCRTCGVYIAAVTGTAERIVSTLNVAGLRMMEFLDLEQAPMDYGAETTKTRIDRRFERWTPTRFTDAALAAGYFGPH